jgi:hypothetical protein
MRVLKSRQARFEVLSREHHSAVQAYVRRRVPPEDVDDIVSDTFLVVWRRLDELGPSADRAATIGHYASPIGLGSVPIVAYRRHLTASRRQLDNPR